MMYRRRHEVAQGRETRRRRVGEVLNGTVVHVPDGDGLTVHTSVDVVTVRMWGIDAPEMAQAFGLGAREYLYALAYGKEVRLIVRGGDRYGRAICDVYLADGLRICDQMVANGWAWWYREYAPRAETLKTFELVARRDRRGLWKDADPVPPWVFRGGVEMVPMSLAGVVWRVGRSLRFHRPGCRRMFGSRKAMMKGRAMAVGFRPCAMCRP